MFFGAVITKYRYFEVCKRIPVSEIGIAAGFEYFHTTKEARLNEEQPRSSLANVPG